MSNRVENTSFLKQIDYFVVTFPLRLYLAKLIFESILLTLRNDMAK